MRSSSERGQRQAFRQLSRMLLGILKNKVWIIQIAGRRSEMGHLSTHEIDQMSMEQMLRRLEEMREELLQLRAQQALGGSSSNPGEFKQTRRSIARLLTSINKERKE